jgi:hypothetical protein
MGYSTPIKFFKYLHYYWAGSNSKGHGIHSPFVFKLIQEQLNGGVESTEFEKTTPAMRQYLLEIEQATLNQLSNKTTRLIGRLLSGFHPTNFCILSNTIKTSRLASLQRIDCAFLVASDSLEVILHHANSAFQKMHPAAWMIVQGIHSSAVMETAWERLKKNDQVRLTIDLFSIGILFCRKEQKEKEHFIIRY